MLVKLYLCTSEDTHFCSKDILRLISTFPDILVLFLLIYNVSHFLNESMKKSSLKRKKRHAKTSQGEQVTINTLNFFFGSNLIFHSVIDYSEGFI